MSEAAAAPLESISYLEKLGLLLAGQSLEASARRSAVLAFVLPQEILPAPHASDAPHAPTCTREKTHKHTHFRMLSSDWFRTNLVAARPGGTGMAHRHGMHALEIALSTVYGNQVLLFVYLYILLVYY